MTMSAWDWALIIWMSFAIIHGYLQGFLAGFLNLLKIIVTLLMMGYGFNWVKSWFEEIIEDELIVIILSILSIILLSILLVAWISHIVEKSFYNYPILRGLNKLLGLILGTIKGLLVIVIILAVCIKLGWQINYINQSTYVTKVKSLAEWILSKKPQDIFL